LEVFACKNQPKEKPDKESFEDILNDPRVNTKEVGEREGIKYFQVDKDGKTGFRDLDGNIVIDPKFDMAEMFSEGYSSVTLFINFPDLLGEDISTSLANLKT
jgi:hypothetical protein